MSEQRHTHDGPDDPEVISDEEWSDDPQGMRGQLDDSMDGLEPGDDAREAARGIPQNADTTSDSDES